MHVCDEDLELYLLERLEKDKKSILESHLTGCEPCASRLTSANIFVQELAEQNRRPPVFGGKEKRSQPRTACDDPGVLQKINPFSSDRENVRILDVSKDGMKVGAPSSLEPGTTVKVRLKSMIAFGEVRYCRAVGEAYHAGIQLQTGIPI
jgi:hypothetical protein